MRVVLPLENGGVAHFRTVFCYQGAERDPDITCSRKRMANIGPLRSQPLLAWSAPYPGG